MVDIARWTRLAGVALLVAVLTGACDTKAQFAPSLPTAAGFRVDGGVLKLWTGTPCAGVHRVTLIFDTGTARSATLEWAAPQPGVALERMDLLRTTGAPVPGAGLEPAEPPPAGYDWTTAEWLNFSVDGPQSWGARVDVARVLRESPQHPAGSYLFGDRGWMEPSDVQRENGKSFLTVCTPDPK
jgi:hypothetical protein